MSKLNPNGISILKESEKMKRGMQCLCFRGKADFIHMSYLYCKILNLYFIKIWKVK